MESSSTREPRSHPDHRTWLFILNDEITAVIVAWLLIQIQLWARSCTMTMWILLNIIVKTSIVLDNKSVEKLWDLSLPEI